ncbi:MAG: hypothetical protein U0838_11865, partial [Chloroflexota bacterium]
MHPATQVVPVMSLASLLARAGNRPPHRRPAQRRLAPWLIALFLVAWLGAGALPAAAAAPIGPKVAIIVGPAGIGTTSRYRAAAEAAARIAERLTPNVVRVYSPNATWPAVKAAVTGASVVVYLGHGNGFPSRYSDHLLPSSQDGFGLNPAPGSGDAAHQYYGESFVSGLRLAPGAVVLLNHLCYASGNTEPGLPEGTFDQSLGRADGFAAGFLRAGASLVVAEGHADPGALIEAAIAGTAPLAAAWRSAGWGHGHLQSYPSARTAGATVSLDPDRPASGFYRSMVEASSGGTVRPAAVAGQLEVLELAPPSLAQSGVRFGTASLAAAPMPGKKTSIRIPVTAAASALPARLTVGLRFLPLDAPSAASGRMTSDQEIVVGEAADDVVQTSASSLAGGALATSAQLPADPGAYLVLATVQTADGTPYDTATQALLRPFIVVVPKAVAAHLEAPASLEAAAGAPVSVPVVARNAGTGAWGSPLYAKLWNAAAAEPWLEDLLGDALVLNAVWLDPATGAAIPAAAYPLPRQLGAPGQEASVGLAVR